MTGVPTQPKGARSYAGIEVYTGVHPVDSDQELCKVYDGLECVGEVWATTGLLTHRWDRGQTPRSMRRAAVAFREAA